MNRLLSFFSKSDCIADDKTKEHTNMEHSLLFLTTHGLNFYIEKIIKNAEKFIFIVTPYFKLEKRLEELILDQKVKGVKVYVICRADSLKTKISIADKIIDRKNLHAKCFVTEKDAIVGSLNLYEFSQINNDEMGFYISKEYSVDIYESIYNEVLRFMNINRDNGHIIENSNTQVDGVFHVGKKYSFEVIDSFFNFSYKKPSGIKETQHGDIVLFYGSSQKYINIEENNIIYFQGQNTGSTTQQLIYGNKALFNAFNKREAKIYLFKNYIYQGLCSVCYKPYLENGKWIFPIKLN